MLITVRIKNNMFSCYNFITYRTDINSVITAVFYAGAWYVIDFLFNNFTVTGSRDYFLSDKNFAAYGTMCACCLAVCCTSSRNCLIVDNLMSLLRCFILSNKPCVASRAVFTCCKTCACACCRYCIETDYGMTCGNCFLSLDNLVAESTLCTFRLSGCCASFCYCGKNDNIRIFGIISIGILDVIVASCTTR